MGIDKDKICVCVKRDTLKKIFISILIFLPIILLILAMAHELGDTFWTDIKLGKESNIKINISTALLVVVTAILAIANVVLVYTVFKQAKDLNKTNKAEYLIKVKQMLENEWVFESAKKIHEYEMNAYQKLHGPKIKSNFHSRESRKERLEIVHQIIDKVSTDPEKSHEFMCLLFHLHTLEYIAYLCNNGLLDEEIVNEMIGSEYKYYYKIFNGWMDKRKYDYTERYCCEFKKLVDG